MPDNTASSPQPQALADARIAALARLGAAHSDPLRFHFIEALARRAQTHRGASRRLLDARLEKALDECAARCAEARQAAERALAQTATRHPDAAATLESLFAAGDFIGLLRFTGTLDDDGTRRPLADLVAYVAERSAPGPNVGDVPGKTTDTAPAAPPVPSAEPAHELKSLRYFRRTWSALSVDRQLAQGPENAGPLNSHRLVLRSLQLMRDVAPNYLERFMSYADALLWLEQADGAPPPKKAPPPAKAARGASAPGAGTNGRRPEQPGPTGG